MKQKQKGLRLPANPCTEPTESQTITSSPPFLRATGRRKPPKRVTEKPPPAIDPYESLGKGWGWFGGGGGNVLQNVSPAPSNLLSYPSFLSFFSNRSYSLKIQAQ